MVFIIHKYDEPTELSTSDKHLKIKPQRKISRYPPGSADPPLRHIQTAPVEASGTRRALMSVSAKDEADLILWMVAKSISHHLRNPGMMVPL